MTDSLLAGFSSTSYTPEKLVAGDMELVPRSITLLSGQNLDRGAVLGKTATAGTIAATADAGNAGGTGTMGSLSVGAAAKEGRYRVVCVEPATNAGKFLVIDPNGVEVGTATVAVAFTGPINFTIADGATDFISGEGFSVDVSAVTFKHKLSAAAATDGSQVPDLILAVACDATAGDAAASAYETGLFFETAVILGAGHTIASIREGLRIRGIHFAKSVGA